MEQPQPSLLLLPNGDVAVALLPSPPTLGPVALQLLNTAWARKEKSGDASDASAGLTFKERHEALRARLQALHCGVVGKHPHPFLPEGVVDQTTVDKLTGSDATPGHPTSGHLTRAALTASNLSELKQQGDHNPLDDTLVLVDVMALDDDEALLLLSGNKTVAKVFQQMCAGALQEYKDELEKAYSQRLEELVSDAHDL